MTPDNPQDPQKGKVDEAAVPEEAKDAKQAPVAGEAAEQPEPKPRRRRKKAAEPEAAGTAAEETGVDKTAADAIASADDEPAAAATGDDETPAEAEPAAAATGDDSSAADETPAEPVAAGDDEPEAAPDDDSPAGDEESAPVATEAPKRRRRGRKREEEEAPPEPAPSPRRNGRRDAEPAVLVKAQARYVRTSARKARLVCDHIRGKDVSEARAILAFTPRAAAKAWTKLLESAVASAEHNHELVGDELTIHSVHADEGPTLKRYRPRAMGRATRIRKRTSHLTITLTPKES